jgi:mannose-6-phosphate isomerase-like protein (cupin superfamily)
MLNLIDLEQILKTTSQSPKSIAAGLTEYWSPRVISELDDSYIKVAKIKGQLAWHDHAFEDELFMILQGQLVIEFRHGAVTLNEGDVYVVPKGVEHNPFAKEECLIMLIEKKSTAHTGMVKSPMTRSLDEQLRTIN